ncbi:MAG: trehalose-6-phosphate synthase [Actinomycetota bacterium]|nr:trehalose-6-phosphate synthase [Actinomycetota bacterium]
MSREDPDIVLVSNRGPVSFIEERTGDFGIERGAGGLAGALDWVARDLGDRAMWIAAATSPADRAAMQAGKVSDLRSLLGYPVLLLDIEHDTYERYYNEVSNRLLWFANHCLWTELGVTGFDDDTMHAWMDAYEPVNEHFAEAVADAASEDSLVLFQDYHLATAPRHLRRIGDNRTILHFTHSSFCGPECLNALPGPIPEKVIEGMLGADLLGFHVPRWAHGFLRCCESIGARVDYGRGLVEHAGHRSWVRSYPIPIDAGELKERARKGPARNWAERYGSYGGRLLVRGDRAEPSKNIVRGFQAFGRMLDHRPDLVGDVRFIACLYPTRQAMLEYRVYLEQLQRAAQEVNDRHPNSIELTVEADFNRVLGAYLVYDALLVNSLMDGMNLVSKEGAAINETDGVLVLARGAGSYEELGDHALVIDDPQDIEETAVALERAFDMRPDERSRRAENLRSIVARRLPQEWISEQIADLEAIRSGLEPATPAR